VRHSRWYSRGRVIATSPTLMQSLYAAESNYLVTVESLAAQ
jgi:hypothetical protein